jgi:nucleoside-diphosphate-sugar epimerase
MKKLLLTGAKGFTGCYLSEAAKKEGFEVFPLLSNLTDLTSIKSEVQRIEPDYVIHLGAISYLEYANMIDLLYPFLSFLYIYFYLFYRFTATT